MSFRANAGLDAVCIDIETMHAEEDAIQRELDLWQPAGTWKPATVATRKKEFETKTREKSALLDAAPISTIGVCDAQGDAVVFHWLKFDTMDCETFYSYQCESEREMLKAFRTWADNNTDKTTTIVGFNLNFDLPHLRIAYTRHGLRLPQMLIPKRNWSEDVMWLFSKNFMSKDTAFISLDEVVKRLDIAPEGKQMSGADAPDYAASDDMEKHETLIAYNAADVLLTMRAFLICTGQMGD